MGARGPCRIMCLSGGAGKEGMGNMGVMDVRVDVSLPVSSNATQEACDILAYVAAHCAEACMRQVASRFGMHPNTVGRLVRDACDLTFSEVVHEMRLQRARALLAIGADMPQVARVCGFSKPERLRAELAADEAAHGRPAALKARELAFATTVRVFLPTASDSEPAGLASHMVSYIERNCADVTLSRVADEFGLHPNAAAAAVRRFTGKTFSQVLIEARMARARRLLDAGDCSIEQVSRACGYENPASFYRAFRRAYGCTPRALCS